jgi:peptidoglycan/LPS O-acetylase OafA/YrhL
MAAQRLMDERRYYGLDALRGVAMLLGIVLHTAMFYMASEIIPIADPQRSPVFDVVVLFIHSFRMPLFFLLSGFFAALLVEKYGLKRAYRNRFDRILVPFLVACVTVVPIAGWLSLCYGVSSEAGAKLLWSMKAEHLEWAGRVQRKLYAERDRLPAPAHLWFLYYLMLFYLLLPVCAIVERFLRDPARAAAVRRVAASPWLPLALGAWSAFTLWPYHGAFVGLTYLRPQLSSLLYYGTFFVIGYLLHAFRGFLDASCRHLGAYALTSALLFAASVAPSHLDFLQGGSSFRLHLATVLINGPLTWLLIFASIGLFQSFFDHDSPWVAYISQSSYWVYLVHLPFACLGAWYLVDFAVPAVVKFAAVAAFTTLGSFVSYHYLVRRTWISVMLNGRRFSLRWPWLEQAGGAYSVPLGRAADPSVDLNTRPAASG